MFFVKNSQLDCVCFFLQTKLIKPYFKHNFMMNDAARLHNLIELHLFGTPIPKFFEMKPNSLSNIFKSIQLLIKSERLHLTRQ